MNGYYRTADANFNRAREGLRVLEDICRFVLGDAALASAFRAARHRLALLSGRFFPGRLLLAHRSVESDAGRVFPGAGRRGAADLVAANCARVGEAARVLEELGALLAPPAADEFRRVRFAVYALEKKLAARFRAALPARCLYVVADPGRAGGSPAGFARRLMESGARVVQLRPGALGDRAFLAAARALADEANRRGVLFLVGERPDIALLSGAAGVHLERDGGLAAAQARRLCPDRLIGVAAARQGGNDADWRAADFVSFECAGPLAPGAAETLAAGRGAVVFGRLAPAASRALFRRGGCRGVTVRCAGR